MESVLVKKPAILENSSFAKIGNSAGEVKTSIGSELRRYVNYTINGQILKIELEYEPEEIKIIGGNALASKKSIIYIVPQIFSSDLSIQHQVFVVRPIAKEKKKEIEMTSVVEPLEAACTSDSPLPRARLLSDNSVVNFKDLRRMPEIVVLRELTADMLRLKRGELLELVKTYGNTII